MNIISAYRQVGSYRGAAELCGTSHKSVKRVVEKAEGGGSTPRECRGHVISTWPPSWRPPESTNLVAGSRRSGCYRSPARPGTVTARRRRRWLRVIALFSRAHRVLRCRVRFCWIHPDCELFVVAQHPRRHHQRWASPGRADLPAPQPTGGR